MVLGGQYRCVSAVLGVSSVRKLLFRSWSPTVSQASLMNTVSWSRTEFLPNKIEKDLVVVGLLVSSSTG